MAKSEGPIRQAAQRLIPGEHGVGRLIAELHMTDIDGRPLSLSAYRHHTALVIAFTNTSCPICKKYAATLAALEDRYAKQNVAFLFINPTASDKLATIRESIATQGFDGRYGRDDEQVFARALGAKHTTDVFVLDARRTLVYRGAVDDQYGFGYSLDEPRVAFLSQALDAVLAGEKILISATQAPGCPLDATSASVSTKSTSASSEITYHNRISRIMQNHCVQCHREGGVGPFELDNYHSVASQSGAIGRVVEERIMPPWFAAQPKPGEVSPFVNDCSLSDVDRSDLLTWLVGEKVVRDIADAPLAREFHDGWQIGQPDLILQLPTPVAVKATGTMPYQHVIVDTGFTEDRYVSAVEVKPTNGAVVHHCLVFVVPPGKQLGRDQEVDERDGFFAAYAPGYDALRFNDGFGKVIPAGSRLLFQLHYTPNGVATTDQTRMGLIFADDPPRHPVNVKGVSQHRLAIPPHASNHEVSAEVTLPKPATILAFFPHMHLRGKAFRYVAKLPDGTEKTLLDIPRYDFNWQLSYRLAEPLTLPAGSVVRATAWYDNSAGNPANPDPSRTVPWGPQTYDEMMIGYIEYHMEDGKLDRAASSPVVQVLKNLGTGKNVSAAFKKYDKNNDGKLSSDELPTRFKTQLMRLDSDGDGFITAKEAERLEDLLKRR